MRDIRLIYRQRDPVFYTYNFEPHSQRRTKPMMWHKWPLCGISSDPTLNGSGDGHNTKWLDYITEACSNPGITVYEAAQFSAY